MKQTTINEHFFENPIKILNRLKEAGFSKKQAEAQVEIFSEFVDNKLATRSDITSLSKDISNFEKNLDLKLSELEAKLTIKTATIVGSIIGFFFILEKFVN